MRREGKEGSKEKKKRIQIGRVERQRNKRKRGKLSEKMTETI